MAIKSVNKKVRKIELVETILRKMKMVTPKTKQKIMEETKISRNTVMEPMEG